ncbi:MAG: hypothetical protein HY543_11385 [Deltaproteobacteria bacterium]|nr:hypothetical protein [Deltaproteobacteria bacterium]
MNLTSKGFPKIAGSYKVLDSSCAFAVQGGGFSLSQNEASLSISASTASDAMPATPAPAPDISAPTAPSTTKLSLSLPPPEEAAADGADGGAAATAVPSSSTTISATIDKSGRLQGQITASGASFDCSGDATTTGLQLNCASPKGDCAVTAEKAVGQTPSTQTTKTE